MSRKEHAKSKNKSNVFTGTLFLKELPIEAVVQRSSVKKVFLEISQNSRKTPVPESLF